MCLYEILGVDKNATVAEIKAAYRKLAHRLHPDKNIGDTESEKEFIEVQLAYDILGDPEKRAEYDIHGKVETKEDHIRKQANDSLCVIFITLVDGVGDIDISDMKALIITNIENNSNNMKSNLVNQKRMLVRYEKAKKKVSKSKNKIFERAIDEKIKDAEDNIVSKEFEIEICSEMLNLVKDFDYEFDDPFVSSGHSFQWYAPGQE